MGFKNFLQAYEKIELLKEDLFLLPEKALYWQAKKLLLIANIRFGKSESFQIEEISKTSNKNWKQIHQLIRLYQPNRLCFLGGLFQSTKIKEWRVFGELIQSYENVSFELVLGSHENLPAAAYLDLGFNKVYETLVEPPFVFSHDLLESSSFYNISAQVKPGIELKGKKTYKASCFYFGKKQAFLPAFNDFSDLTIMDLKESARVFVLSENQVIPIA